MRASLHPCARPRSRVSSISSGRMVQAPGSFGSFRKVQYEQRSRQRFVTGRKILREYVTVRPHPRSRSADASAITAAGSSWATRRSKSTATGREKLIRGLLGLCDRTARGSRLSSDDDGRRRARDERGLGIKRTPLPGLGAWVRSRFFATRARRLRENGGPMPLSASQIAALDYVTKYARSRRDEALAVQEPLASIKRSARVALHFHPDRPSASGETVAQGLLREGRYRSQFETRISN